ncbi:TPA: ead/Ea22-like family protein [Enterobacter roggenkampii]|nr:ead/Ea22-like family protein [Enterobacter roggenkampii]
MINIDKRALREAAEKATPGRIGDRIDGSGSIKYQCFGNDGSLVLQTDHKNMEYGFIGENSEADELFFRMCDPATVLALLDELEAKDRQILKMEKLAEAESVGADKAATFGVEWMKRYHAAEKRIAELELKLEAADKLQDSAFRHGLQHGFSLGQTDNQAGFEECLSAYGTGKGE